MARLPNPLTLMGTGGTAGPAGQSGLPVFNVVTYGAQSDTLANAAAGTPTGGLTTSNAFKNAWAAATAVNGGAIFYIPAGNYVVDPFVAAMTTTTPNLVIMTPGIGSAVLWHYDPNAHGAQTMMKVNISQSTFWVPTSGMHFSRACVITGLQIDGTNAPAGSTGLDYGPGVSAVFEVRIGNYAGGGATPSRGMIMRSGNGGIYNNSGWTENTHFLQGTWFDNCDICLDIAADGVNSFQGTVFDHTYIRLANNAGQRGVRIGGGITHTLTAASVSAAQTPTATGSGGANTIVVSSNTGLVNGMAVTGTGIASGAYVTNIAGTTITLSANNTSTVSGGMTFAATVTWTLSSGMFINDGHLLDVSAVTGGSNYAGTWKVVQGGPAGTTTFTTGTVNVQSQTASGTLTAGTLTTKCDMYQSVLDLELTEGIPTVGLGAISALTFNNPYTSLTTNGYTVTNAVGDGTYVTYTANNDLNAVTVGQTVTITGVTPSAYNLTNQTVTAASATSFTVTNAATGAYTSGGTVWPIVTIYDGQPLRLSTGGAAGSPAVSPYQFVLASGTSTLGASTGTINTQAFTAIATYSGTTTVKLAVAGLVIGDYPTDSSDVIGSRIFLTGEDGRYGNCGFLVNGDYGTNGAALTAGGTVDLVTHSGILSQVNTAGNFTWGAGYFAAQESFGANNSRFPNTLSGSQAQSGTTSSGPAAINGLTTTGQVVSFDTLLSSGSIGRVLSSKNITTGTVDEIVSTGITSGQMLWLRQSASTMTGQGIWLDMTHGASGTFSTGQYIRGSNGGVTRFDILPNGAFVSYAQAVNVAANAGTVSSSAGVSNFTNSSAAAMTITMAITSPTPVDGQVSIVRVYDATAASQNITWVNTENSGVSVPATTTGVTASPKTVTFQWNTVSSKWRCIESV